MKESTTIKGKGLVALGNWIVERHDQYKKNLRKRTHKMIAVITLAEKAEREKDEKIQKAILGYARKSDWAPTFKSAIRAT